MKNLAFISLFLILSPSILAQQNRIAVNNQEIWFNGGNVAWVNFARDVGPTSFPENDFQAMFDQVQENGGNAMSIMETGFGGVKELIQKKIISLCGDLRLNI